MSWSPGSRFQGCQFLCKADVCGIAILTEVLHNVIAYHLTHLITIKIVHWNVKGVGVSLLRQGCTVVVQYQLSGTHHREVHLWDGYTLFFPRWSFSEYLMRCKGTKVYDTKDHKTAYPLRQFHKPVKNCGWNPSLIFLGDGLKTFVDTVTDNLINSPTSL